MLKSEQRESLASIVASINKKYGDDIIVQGSQVREELPRITTGVLAFDLMLGDSKLNNGLCPPMTARSARQLNQEV